MATRKDDAPNPHRDPFILGRTKFERISAVEGITLSSAMKDRAAKSDRKNLSAEERRRTIIAAHRKT
ncbi:MAG: hypothetical protein WBA29_09605 [Xanthobacteraceae bacterium]